MINFKDIDSEKLIKYMLCGDNSNNVEDCLWNWRLQCEIIENYISPYLTQGRIVNPRCVVKFGNMFLRHSCGPLQHHFWDIYGDNYISPELALIALSQAQPPVNVVRFGVEGFLNEQ